MVYFQINKNIVLKGMKINNATHQGTHFWLIVLRTFFKKYDNTISIISYTLQHYAIFYRQFISNHIDSNLRDVW